MKINKKGSLAQEMLPFIIGLLIIYFSLFFLSKLMISTSEHIEKSPPELTYEFPATFIYSFLNYELTDSEKSQMDLNPNSTYFVKDIIKENSDKNFNILKNSVRKRYLDWSNQALVGTSTMHTQYKKFSGQNYNVDSILVLENNLQSPPNLDLAIEKKNYVFFLKTNDGTYSAILFKEQSGVLQ